MHHLPVPQSWSLWAFQVPEMPLHPRFLLLHPRPCPPLCILALCLGAVMVLYRMSRRTPADILESSGTWFHHLVSLALWSVFHPLAYDICSALCIWWLMLPLYTLKISTSCFPLSSAGIRFPMSQGRGVFLPNLRSKRYLLHSLWTSVRSFYSILDSL